MCKLPGSICFSLLLLVLPAAGLWADQNKARQDEQFIKTYLENLVYMVYIDEDTNVAPENKFLLKKAVAVANDYLTSHAMEAVLLDEVEKLKQDQETLYQEDSGGDISVVQWLAQKLNADVYITLNLRITSETKRKNHFAQASITLTAFESSTGRLMGSKTYNQPEKSFSPTSEEEAKINAVEVSVKRIMQDIIDTSREYMKKALKKGIKYEVFLDGAGDSGVIGEFIASLKRRVKDVQTVYRTDEQAKCYVWALVTNQDLEQLVLDTAKTIPGLEGMVTVSVRRKSLTFSTGL
ncbi:MAG: DUF6175 family protein [Spirochaetia bacterium]